MKEITEMKINEKGTGLFLWAVFLKYKKKKRMFVHKISHFTIGRISINKI
jgi:hypothetical protein